MFKQLTQWNVSHKQGVCRGVFQRSVFTLRARSLPSHILIAHDMVCPLQINSLLVAGWAGLVVNALNCIPAGELDGGRIALSIW
jgi:Zn-dependent protease